MIVSLDDLIADSRMPSAMVMTDLKDERLALEKKSKFDSNRHNLAAADQAVELANEDAEASEDGQAKTKARNKKRKKPNKKKKKNAANVDEDLTTADKGEEQKEQAPQQEEMKFVETNVQEWQSNLNAELMKREMDSDEDAPVSTRQTPQVGVTEGNDDEYFDDHWFERVTDNPGKADVPVEHPLTPANMPVVKAPDAIDTNDIHLEIMDTLNPIVSVEKCKQNYKAKKDAKEKQE